MPLISLAIASLLASAPAVDGPQQSHLFAAALHQAGIGPAPGPAPMRLRPRSRTRPRAPIVVITTTPGGVVTDAEPRRPPREPPPAVPAKVREARGGLALGSTFAAIGVPMTIAGLVAAANGADEPTSVGLGVSGATGMALGATIIVMSVQTLRRHRGWRQTARRPSVIPTALGVVGSF